MQKSSTNIQEGHLSITRWSLKSQRPTSQGVHREVLGPCVLKITYKRAPKISISFHGKYRVHEPATLDLVNLTVPNSCPMDVDRTDHTSSPHFSSAKFHLSSRETIFN